MSKDEADFLDVMIDASHSAAGLYDAAAEIRYQIKNRPDADMSDLQAAYETVRRHVVRLAGCPAEHEPLVDVLIDRDQTILPT